MGLRSTFGNILSAVDEAAAATNTGMRTINKSFGLAETEVDVIAAERSKQLRKLRKKNKSGGKKKK